jgi:hypothetical protein
MGTINKLVKALKKERDAVEKQLNGLNAALSAFTDVYTGKTKRKKGTISAAGRARIAKAQKARWKKIRTAKKG